MNSSHSIQHLRDGKFAVLLTASLISSLIMLDSNIVAVSLPTIARELGATFADIEWVVSAYVLTFAALLLAAGAYADRHGRKQAALIGLGIFTVSSLLCGLAPSVLMLNLARASQGVGASFLLTAALAVINHAFTGAERTKAYAFWGVCLGIAITTGPIVGGVITDFLGWRWAFLVNLPVCTVLTVAAARVFVESRDHDAKRLDLAGIATFSTGLFFLIRALIDGNSVGWTTTVIMGRLAAAFALLSLFILFELKQSRPMVDLTLFRQPTFLGSNVANFGYAAGAQVMIFYLPLYLQNAYAFKPLSAGFAMLPFALPMFLAPRVGARLAAHYSGRALLAGGLLTTVIGNLGLCAAATLSLPYAGLAVGMLVAGAGAGLLNSETAKVLQGAVPVQRAGMASGLGTTTRFTSLLIAVAGLGAVLGDVATRQFVPAAVQRGLTSDAAFVTVKRVISGDVVGALSNFPEQLRTTLEQIGIDAFARGFAAAAFVAAVVAAASAVLTVVLVRASETAAIKAISRSNDR